MVLHRTHMPASSNAAYHARRLARLRSRLGNICALCGTHPTPSRPAGFMQADHTHGNGGAARTAAKGHSGELSRLLALPEGALHHEVRLLCDPCHASAPTTTRFTSTKTGA